MCLIIHKPADIVVPEDTLITAYENNDDGMGIMYIEEGAVKTKRIMPKGPEDVLKLYDQFKDREVGIHFRWTTHGDTVKQMAHPLNVLHHDRDGSDLYMMHNGVLSGQSERIKANSDTWHFIQDTVRPLVLKFGPEIIRDPIFARMLGNLIGSNNKLLFLDGDGNYTKINAASGNTNSVEGCWLSNSYSLTPGHRSAKSKTYEYTYGNDIWENSYSYPQSTHTYPNSAVIRPYVSQPRGIPLWEKSQQMAKDQQLAKDMLAKANKTVDKVVPIKPIVAAVATITAQPLKTPGVREGYTSWWKGFSKSKADKSKQAQDSITMVEDFLEGSTYGGKTVEDLLDMSTQALDAWYDKAASVSTKDLLWDLLTYYEFYETCEGNDDSPV